MKVQAQQLAAAVVLAFATAAFLASGASATNTVVTSQDAIERYLNNAARTEAVRPDDRAEVRGPALASSTVPDAIERYLDNGLGTKAVRPDDRAEVRGPALAAAELTPSPSFVSGEDFHWNDAAIGARRDARTRPRTDHPGRHPAASKRRPPLSVRRDGAAAEAKPPRLAAPALFRALFDRRRHLLVADTIRVRSEAGGRQRRFFEHRQLHQDDSRADDCWSVSSAARRVRTVKAGRPNSASSLLEEEEPDEVAVSCRNAGRVSSSDA